MIYVRKYIFFRSISCVLISMAEQKKKTKMHESLEQFPNSLEFNIAMFLSIGSH